MTDDVLTAEERQEIDARMRRILLLSTKGLNKRHKNDSDSQIEKDAYFLSKVSVSWNLFASGERQEALMNKMQKDSERMTCLISGITILSVAVVVLSAIQVWWVVSR